MYIFALVIKRAFIFFPDIQCDLKMAVNIFLLLVNKFTFCLLYICVIACFFVMTTQYVFMDCV